MQNGHYAQQSSAVGLIKHSKMLLLSVSPHKPWLNFLDYFAISYLSCRIPLLKELSVASISYLCARNKGFILVVPPSLSFLPNRPPRTADPTDLHLLLRPPRPLLLLLYLGSYHKLIARNGFLISLPPILYKQAVISAKHKSEMSIPTFKCPVTPAGVFRRYGVSISTHKSLFDSDVASRCILSGSKILW